MDSKLKSVGQVLCATLVVSVALWPLTQYPVPVPGPKAFSSPSPRRPQRAQAPFLLPRKTYHAPVLAAAAPSIAPHRAFLHRRLVCRRRVGRCWGPNPRAGRQQRQQWRSGRASLRCYHRACHLCRPPQRLKWLREWFLGEACWEGWKDTAAPGEGKNCLNSPPSISSPCQRCCKILTFSRDEFRIECLKLTWQQGVLDAKTCMFHRAYQSSFRGVAATEKKLSLCTPPLDAGSYLTKWKKLLRLSSCCVIYLLGGSAFRLDGQPRIPLANLFRQIKVWGILVGGVQFLQNQRNVNAHWAEQKSNFLPILDIEEVLDPPCQLSMNTEECLRTWNPLFGRPILQTFYTWSPPWGRLNGPSGE